MSSKREMMEVVPMPGTSSGHKKKVKADVSKEKGEDNVGQQSSEVAVKTVAQLLLENPPKYNPLLNPVVLDILFQYCDSPEEVMRNRLVCQLWRYENHSRWTKKCSALTLYKYARASEDGKTLAEINRLCASSDKGIKDTVPNQRFIFREWSLDQTLLRILRKINHGNFTPHNNHERFWARIAPTLLTDLTLDHCSFEVDFTTFMSDLLHALPNLVRLALKQCQPEHWVAEDYRSLLMFHYLLMDHTRILTGPVHHNLQHISLEAIPNRRYYNARELINVLTFLPAVKTITCRALEEPTTAVFFRGVVAVCKKGILRRSLQELDLLDFSGVAGSSGIFDNFDNCLQHMQALRVLRFDLGRDPTIDSKVAKRGHQSLRQLHLYRSPSFADAEPLGAKIQHILRNLTELHLWGNVVHNLDFLVYCDNLQVLVLNITGYEPKYNGRRVVTKLDPNQGLICHLPRDLVMTTTKMPRARVHLTKLELDWAPTSHRSWSTLQAWMPNLTSLQAKVTSVAHLSQIRRQWRNLQFLELSHGSLVPGDLLTFTVLAKFEHLISFVWMQCPCNDHLWREVDDQLLRELEYSMDTALRRKRGNPPKSPGAGQNTPNTCIQAVYEKMLKTGNTREFLQLTT